VGMSCYSDGGEELVTSIAYKTNLLLILKIPLKVTRLLVSVVDERWERFYSL